MRLLMRALCLVAVPAGLLGMTAADVQAAPPPPLGAARSYTAGKYALEIGGAAAGWVHAVEGGHATSDVVEEPGTLYYTKKHLANVKYRAITLEVGLPMSEPIFDWIKASVEGNYQRKNGAIVAVDYQGRITSVREFFNALVSEVEFPAVDAASKDPARVRITLQPEFTRLSADRKGTKLQIPFCKSPLLLSSNFRLAIDGIDAMKASGIAPLSIKIVLTESPVGEERDYERVATRISFPNVLVTMPQSGLQSFNQWFEDFVIQGNNSDESERAGSLEYLTPNLSQSPFRLGFQNMGIFEIEPESPSQSESIPMSVVKMYIERMALSQTAPACGAQ